MHTAFILTTRGIPQLYYGEEIAMAGGHDPVTAKIFPAVFRVMAAMDSRKMEGRRMRSGCLNRPSNLSGSVAKPIRCVRESRSISSIKKKKTCAAGSILRPQKAGRRWWHSTFQKKKFRQRIIFIFQDRERRDAVLVYDCSGIAKTTRGKQVHERPLAPRVFSDKSCDAESRIKR